MGILRVKQQHSPSGVSERPLLDMAGSSCQTLKLKRITLVLTFVNFVF